MPAIRELKLHSQIEYALQTRGKNLRSTMVLLSGESIGGNKERLQKLALAIELLHLGLWFTTTFWTVRFSVETPFQCKLDGA